MAKRQTKTDTGAPGAGEAAYSRVIVLSDDAALQRDLSAMLANSAYQAQLVADSAIFDSLCSAGGAPAAIILDVSPSNNTDEIKRVVAGAQAKFHNGVPVIFVADRKNIAARLAAHRAGATRYLSKPVQREQLLKTIAETVPAQPAQAYRVMLVNEPSAKLEEQAQMLRNAGLEVRVVNEPLLVPAMLENFAADVLILCLESEQCSGPELAALLREEPQFAEPPVIFLATEAELCCKDCIRSAAIAKTI